MALARSSQHYFRGAMLGVAIGDSLGARFEGARYVDEAVLEAWLEDCSDLRYTDDTHMSLGMAQSLVEHGGFDGQRMAERFAENFRAEPWRGYGPGPPQVFRMIREGLAWDQAAQRLFGGEGSFGNGAAMRVAPAALAECRDLDRVEWLASQTATITHAHKLGVEGAVLQACAIAHLVMLDPAAPFDRTTLLNALTTRVKCREFRMALDRVDQLCSDDDEERVAAEIGNGIEATAAVPAALWAFLRSPTSFADTIRSAILLAGDTDTIASMAGALSGAYLGASAIPSRWLARLEAADTLTGLADRLHALAHR